MSCVNYCCKEQNLTKQVNYKPWIATRVEVIDALGALVIAVVQKLGAGGKEFMMTHGHKVLKTKTTLGSLCVSTTESWQSSWSERLGLKPHLWSFVHGTLVKLVNLSDAPVPHQQKGAEQYNLSSIILKSRERV